MKAPWRSLAILASAASLATVGACAAPAPTPSTTSASLRLVTIDAHQTMAMDAQFWGELVVDEDGCVQAKSPGDSSLYTLAWPQGYTVRGDSESFDIVDASNNVVVGSGSQFSIGGGLWDYPRDNWTERSCAKGSLWIVADPRRSHG